MIGRVKYQLSDVYEQATKLNIMSKHRRINDGIRQSYFEQTTGMISSKSKSPSFFKQALVVGGVAILVGGTLGYVWNNKS